MNRKRLALTAAVIGAIAYPVWTGSQRDAACHPIYAFTHGFEALKDARSPITGAYDPHHNPLDTLKGTSHEGDDFSIYAGSPNEESTRAIMALKDRRAVEARTEKVGCDYQSDLLVEGLLGATSAAALAYFGPRLLTRLLAGLIAVWLHWLRWVRE